MLLTPMVYLATITCKLNNWSTQCGKRLVEAADLSMLTELILKTTLKNDESKRKHLARTISLRTGLVKQLKYQNTKI